MKKAAEEISVTPAAITHQVKALEEFLGIKLFRRRNRTLELTKTGQEIYPVLHEAFVSVSTALRNATWEKSSRVTLSLLPSFAQKWLAPKLIRFRAQHPEITIQITTSMAPVDFATEPVDAAIRVGQGRWPNLKSQLLIEDEFFPVCSPQLLDDVPDPTDPQILARYPLLTTVRRPDDWRIWLEAAGVTNVNPRRQFVHENSALALEMAVYGLGFAITRQVFAMHDIEKGRLVAPFSTKVKSGMGYYFVVPEAFANRPEIRAVRDWLVSESHGTA